MDFRLREANSRTELPREILNAKFYQYESDVSTYLELIDVFKENNDKSREKLERDIEAGSDKAISAIKQLKTELIKDTCAHLDRQLEDYKYQAKCVNTDFTRVKDLVTRALDVGEDVGDVASHELHKAKVCVGIPVEKVTSFVASSKELSKCDIGLIVSHSVYDCKPQGSEKRLRKKRLEKHARVRLPRFCHSPAVTTPTSPDLESSRTSLYGSCTPIIASGDANEASAAENSTADQSIDMLASALRAWNALNNEPGCALDESAALSSKDTSSQWNGENSVDYGAHGQSANEKGDEESVVDQRDGCDINKEDAIDPMSRSDVKNESNNNSLYDIPFAVVVGSSGNGIGPSGNGIGPSGNGMGSFGDGIGSFGNGTGSFGNGIGPSGNGIGPSGNGMGSFGTGTGSFGNGMDSFGNGMDSSGDGIGSSSNMIGSFDDLLQTQSLSAHVTPSAAIHGATSQDTESEWKETPSTPTVHIDFSSLSNVRRSLNLDRILSPITEDREECVTPLKRYIKDGCDKGPLSAKLSLVLGPPSLELNYPIGACMFEGGLVVCNSGDHRVLHAQYDTSGVCSRITILDAKFVRPSAVVADKNSNTLFVKDDQCIRRFGPHLRLVTTFPPSRLRLYGLALSADNLLVTMGGCGNGRALPIKTSILKYNFEGDLVATIPLRLPLVPETKLRFMDVFGDNIYISDLGASHVYWSDVNTGCLKKVVATPGRKPGYFTEPSGITCDSEGNILIADSKSNRVQVFDAQYRTFKGLLDCGDKRMVRPSAICLDGDGKLIAVNYLGNSVNIYNLAA